jgi:transitional endoplasmic reticulum ATPase
MTGRNLRPIPKDDLPTEYLKIGKNEVGEERRVVEVRNASDSAYFYAEPMEDFMTSKKGKAEFHPNIGRLFGPGDDIDRGSPFLVDTDVNESKIPDCEGAELFIEGPVTRREVESYLRSRNYLLHPITEVFATEDGLSNLHVLAINPSGYGTVRVTDGTELTFLDRDQFEERKHGPSGGSGGADGRGAPRDGGHEDVDIDLTPEKPTVSFAEDVAGLDEVKETARTLLALFDSGVRSEVERRYSREFAGRGGAMLLYGPPGCGKTLVSEAIAHEAKHNTSIEEEYGAVKFLSVKGGDILSRYPGEAERRVEAVFDQAHGIAQEGFAVLFFDEVETLIPDRSDDGLQRHERSLTNAFLQAMNDVEDNLLVIGATNMPFTIDPAATRRFPIQKFIPQPDEAVMADVWRKQLAPLEAAEGTDTDIDYDRLAAESVGYTPAEVTDRILGTELQRDLVGSVVDEDREPVEPDTAFLLERLRANEPKTVRQYVTSVREEVDRLEGYPEMRRYVERQAEELGITVGGGTLADLLSAADGDAMGGTANAEDDGTDAERPADPEGTGTAGTEGD